VQVKWLAPTDTFLELGAELGAAARIPAVIATRTVLAPELSSLIPAEISARVIVGVRVFRY